MGWVGDVNDIFPHIWFQKCFGIDFMEPSGYNFYRKCPIFTVKVRAVPMQ
jgi:hypothetical protein